MLAAAWERWRIAVLTLSAVRCPNHSVNLGIDILGWLLHGPALAALGRRGKWMTGASSGLLDKGSVPKRRHIYS